MIKLNNNYSKSIPRVTLISLLAMFSGSSHLFAGHPSVFTAAGNPPVKASQFDLKANKDHLGRKIHHVSQLIVSFKNTVTKASGQQITAQYAAGTKRSFGKNGKFKLVNLKAGQTLAQAMATFKSDSNIASVEYNYYVYPQKTPDDPSYSSLWGLNNTGQTFNRIVGVAGSDIKAETAWDSITSCTTSRVAVLDTAIYTNHIDLTNNIRFASMADFIDNDDNPSPTVGTGIDPNGVSANNEVHGSHVTGTIAALGNNSLGVTGVCWNASIIPIRVLSATGGTTVELVSGIDFAIDNGAKVINMSLSTAGSNTAFKEAMDRALAADIVVVAAAGNDGVDVDSGSNPTFPCSFTHANILCVAALDHQFKLASFNATQGSNFGRTSVDVGAPGKFILSTTFSATSAANISPTYSSFQGTSMAAPHVSGVVALVRSWNPGYTAVQTVKAIKNSGVNVADLNNVTTTGKAVNAFSALHYIETPRSVGATVN
ncbi:hypothetical protein MNBD_GAMMA12-83 [hydrothermal vent metagenome]|uniref:Uncharacterized protein n=1 Tax=hydrothermal vent metagenome TaxID=652676 RepID=A0A3B0YT07_9ZZZZ